MLKSRHYPPSYMKYQMENPPLTIHLNKTLKSTIDAVKGNRSYTKFVLDLLNGKFDADKELKRLPLTEAVVKYKNGFREAIDRYTQTGICKKCAGEIDLQKDGICDRCHKQDFLQPTYSKFKDRTTAGWIDEEELKRADIKIPQIERMAYENGRQRGYRERDDEGFEETASLYRITYPCVKCGEPIEMLAGSQEHIEIMGHLKKMGWGHITCLE